MIQKSVATHGGVVGVAQCWELYDSGKEPSPNLVLYVLKKIVKGTDIHLLGRSDCTSIIGQEEKLYQILSS